MNASSRSSTCVRSSAAPVAFRQRGLEEDRDEKPTHPSARDRQSADDALVWGAAGRRCPTKSHRVASANAAAVEHRRQGVSNWHAPGTGDGPSCGGLAHLGAVRTRNVHLVETVTLHAAGRYQL